jgi:chromosome segregation and condensation protein ScpB
MAERTTPVLDRELAGLPQDLRWREWMRRVEAVLFASNTPVAREDLARVVGQGASVDLLIEDLTADLDGRSFEVARVADGWMLAAIAYHQPITREGLKEIFGKDISRELIGRLHDRGLIGTGPRAPRRGAPYTFVTTDQFLVAFDLQSLRDLPDREQLADAGLRRDD